MRFVAVNALADLFAVFDEIERGESIALGTQAEEAQAEAVRLLRDDDQEAQAEAVRLQSNRGTQAEAVRLQSNRGTQAEAVRLQSNRGTQAEAVRLHRDADEVRGRIAVMSSGTTGRAKLVWRDWDELKREVRSGNAYQGWTWASPFQPCTFAGVQVALQAWFSGGKVIQLSSDWKVTLDLLETESVHALSCTPTFLDLLCLNHPAAAARLQAADSVEETGDTGQGTAGGGDSAGRVCSVRAEDEGQRMRGRSDSARRRIEHPGRACSVRAEEGRQRTEDGGDSARREIEHPGRACSPEKNERSTFSSEPGFQPRQITLGGETLRPEQGRRFAACFPHAHFTVVYASAELGVLLKTQRLDGCYEIASLEKRFSGWRIADRILEVLVKGRWCSTNDLVERRGDLIRVIGRADAVANVAGTKISLAEVERRAEEVAGVRMAVARAESNAITGEIVCLRLQPDSPEINEEALQEAVAVHLRAHLPKEAWPRRWEFGTVTVGANAKRAL